MAKEGKFLEQLKVPQGVALGKIHNSLTGCDVKPGCRIKTFDLDLRFDSIWV